MQMVIWKVQQKENALRFVHKLKAKCYFINKKLSNLHGIKAIFIHKFPLMKAHLLLTEENYLAHKETKSFCSTIFRNHHSKSLTTTESVWPSSGYSKNVWPWSPYSRPSHTFSCPEKVDPLYTLAYNLHPYNADFFTSYSFKSLDSIHLWIIKCCEVVLSQQDNLRPWKKPVVCSSKESLYGHVGTLNWPWIDKIPRLLQFQC